MRNLMPLLCLLITIQASAQRFDWASFTPLVTNSGNDGSGGLCITKDDDGFIYTSSTFIVPVLIGNDTIQPAGGINSSNTLITKWNQDGEVVLTKQLAATGSGISPYDLTYDEVNQQVIISVSFTGNSLEIVGDTIIPGTYVAILRLNENLDFISDASLIYTYNSPVISKDGYVYSANGYTSEIRKYDVNNNIIWSLSPSQGSFNATSMIISDQDHIYIVGYLMNNIVNDPVTYGSITVNAPSTGNYTQTGIFKLDTAGNVLSGNYLAECAGSGNPLNIAVDAGENIFVAAPYSIGGQVIGSDTLSNSIGANDAFVLKTDSLFLPQWVTELHHTGGNMETRGILVHPSGKIMVTGIYGANANLGGFVLEPNMYGTGYLVQFDNATGTILYADNYGSLTGTGRPHDLVNIDDRYFLTGLCYSAGPAGGTFGCYTETFTSQFLTCFNDTAFQLPTVSLQFLYPNFVAASNIPNAIYTWYQDGTEIPGVTGSSLTPTANGNYEVTVESYGCEASATYSLTNVGLPGTETIEYGISPNPSTGLFRIKVKNNSPSLINMQVINCIGETVTSIKYSGPDQVIDLTGNAPGIYLLKISNDRESHILKLIRE